MRLIILTIIIFFLQVGQYYGQPEGFEKDLNVYSDAEAGGLIPGAKEHNNFIYTNFTIDCNPSISGCYTEIHKYNVDGELVWAHKLDSLIASFQSFTIEYDKVYILGKRQIPTYDKYFKLVTLDTLGNFIKEQFLKLNLGYYQTQEVTDINLIKGLIYIAGYGYDPNKARFIGYIRVINEEGEEVYFKQWDQIDLGYKRTVIWNVFEKAGVDSLVYFSAVEDDRGYSDFLPTDRHCLYSLNIEEETIDTIFHTDNRKTEGLSRALMGFNSLGNTIFADAHPETNSRHGIEVGEVQEGFMDYDGALWITRIKDADFQENHNILAFRYNSLDVLISEKDEIYVSGILDWSRFDEEIWWNSTCFITKFSSNGEFLWQKIYVEIGDGILNNKSQFIYSLMEMNDNSLIGVGKSSENYSDSSASRKGWMIKINEHGCIDGSEDCPFINFLDTTTSTKNIEYKSISLDVYPNPTSGKCEVNFKEPVNGSLKLFNLSGTLIKEFEVDNTSHFQIDTHSLFKGVHLLLFFPENNPFQVMSQTLIISK